MSRPSLPADDTPRRPAFWPATGASLIAQHPARTAPPLNAPANNLWLPPASSSPTIDWLGPGRIGPLDYPSLLALFAHSPLRRHSVCDAADRTTAIATGSLIPKVSCPASNFFPCPFRRGQRWRSHAAHCKRPVPAVEPLARPPPFLSHSTHTPPPSRRDSRSHPALPVHRCCSCRVAAPSRFVSEIRPPLNADCVAWLLIADVAHCRPARHRRPSP